MSRAYLYSAEHQKENCSFIFTEKNPDLYKITRALKTMATFKVKGKDVYIDGLLQKRLESVKKIIKKNWDAVILIDGQERSGKSTLGMTIGCYFDPNFNTSNMAAGMEDAARMIRDCKEGAVIMVDEGSLVFNSKDAMRKENKNLMKILDVVGQKRITFIVILPSFFDLNKQIAVRRSRFLLHVYTDKKMNRGRFMYFSNNKKPKLYFNGKKNFGSYRKPRSSFRGVFTDYKPEWYDEYLKIKRKSLEEAMTLVDVKADNKWLMQRNYLMKYIMIKDKISQEKLAQNMAKNGHKVTREAISRATSPVTVIL